MIINKQTTIEHESPGLESGDFFSLASDSKIYDILRNQVYSDPLMAIIREYTTNAVDEHIKYGIDKPVDVTLPGLLDNNLVIRDYAKGLSFDQVRSIYTVYGLTTKDNTNAQAGCLGIGSKSAFSYTDIWYIDSYYEGIKTTYLMQLDNTSKGRISKMHEETTDESGIKVTIPIKDKDTLILRDKTSVLRFLPNVHVNGKPIELDILVETDDYYIVNNPNGHNYVVMLGIPYIYHNTKINNKLIFKANAEEVDFSASREHLKDNDKNSAFIERAYNKFVEDVTDYIKTKFDAYSSFIEACTELRDSNLYISTGYVKYYNIYIDLVVKYKDKYSLYNNRFYTKEIPSFVGCAEKIAYKDKWTFKKESTYFNPDNVIFALKDVYNHRQVSKAIAQDENMTVIVLDEIDPDFINPDDVIKLSDYKTKVTKTNNTTYLYSAYDFSEYNYKEALVKTNKPGKIKIQVKNKDFYFNGKLINFYDLDKMLNNLRIHELIYKETDKTQDYIPIEKITEKKLLKYYAVTVKSEFMFMKKFLNNPNIFKNHSVAHHWLKLFPKHMYKSKHRDSRIEKFYRKTINKYPLLKMIGISHLNSTEVQNYVQLVDNAKSDNTI